MLVPPQPIIWSTAYTSSTAGSSKFPPCTSALQLGSGEDVLLQNKLEHLFARLPLLNLVPLRSWVGHRFTKARLSYDID